MTNIRNKRSTVAASLGISSTALATLQKILKNSYKTVTINFDDVANGTVINTYYANQGVTFDTITTAPPSSGGPVYARSGNYAETPPNMITLISPSQSAWLTCFDALYGGIEATFMGLISSVSIDAMAILSPEALGNNDNRPFMEVYGQDGTKIAEVLYPIRFDQPGFGTWQRLSYSSPTCNIASIRFSSQRVGANYVYGAFDTLIFTISYLFRK